jgi:hypothetical protein
VLFSIVALYILFRFFEKANALALRFYIIWGSLLGLVLYLRLLSRFSVRCFLGLYQVLMYLADLIHRGLKIPIRGLVLVMRPPYAVLLWLSLLLYRIGELILFEPILQMKKRMIEWQNRHLPPKI